MPGYCFSSATISAVFHSSNVIVTDSYLPRTTATTPQTINSHRPIMQTFSISIGPHQASSSSNMIGLHFLISCTHEDLHVRQRNDDRLPAVDTFSDRIHFSLR